MPVHPGETINESIQILGISSEDFATRLGISPDELDRILTASTPVTPEVAAALERELDVPAGFWTCMQCNFDQEGNGS